MSKPVAPEISDLMEEASRLARLGNWEAAAASWDLVLESAQAAQLDETAVDAAIKAADALRRAERPLDAIRALRRVADLTEDPRILAAQDVQLVGVLLEAGQLQGAEQLGEARAEDLPPGTMRTIAIDTLLGVFLAAGDAEGFAAWIDHLEDSSSDLTAIALRYRRAQQLRIRGALDESSFQLGQSAAELATIDGAQGARAAVYTAIAEIDLLQGAFENAMTRFEQARAEWKTVGRRGASLQAEAGRIRALLLEGETGVLPTAIDEAITYTWGRGLPLLECELRATRGECRAAAHQPGVNEDFERAMELADQAGAKWLAGRCRYRWFQTTGAGGGEALREAARLLHDDVPWRALVELELAKTLVEVDPEQARQLADSLLDRFASMGMLDSHRRTRDLLGLLPS
jgi:tetratricopeptide (TPR) repeat protein